MACATHYMHGSLMYRAIPSIQIVSASRDACRAGLLTNECCCIGVLRQIVDDAFIFHIIGATISAGVTAGSASTQYVY